MSASKNAMYLDALGLAVHSTLMFIFENSQFTSPTGSPLCSGVRPLLLNLDTTLMYVIKKHPRVKATSMGVDVARYFRIVSVSHAVDFCFFPKIPLIGNGCATE